MRRSIIAITELDKCYFFDKDVYNVFQQPVLCKGFKLIALHIQKNDK